MPHIYLVLINIPFAGKNRLRTYLQLQETTSSCNCTREELWCFSQEWKQYWKQFKTKVLKFKRVNFVKCTNGGSDPTVYDNVINVFTEIKSMTVTTKLREVMSII